jgi:hypothetical protein
MAIVHSGPSARECGKQIVQTEASDHKERWPWLPAARVSTGGNLNGRLTLIGDAWQVQ